MSDEIKTPLDPYKTICVVRNKDGVEVGRIPVTAPNAPQYIDQLAHTYGEVTVHYEEDATGGLLAMLYERR